MIKIIMIKKYESKKIFTQIVKFLIIGLINTIVAYSIIFGLMYIGKSPELSNFMGYLVGITLSYNLNRKFTFKSNVSHIYSVITFFLAISIAYGINFTILKLCLYIFNLNPFASQIISGVFYTITGFLLMKFIVFKEVSSS